MGSVLGEDGWVSVRRQRQSRTTGRKSLEYSDGAWENFGEIYLKGLVRDKDNRREL